MPKRPSDEHGAVAKRARTKNHGEPVSPPSVEPDITRGLLQLALDAFMKEKTGCTVSLTALVDLVGGASSSLPRADASRGSKSGIDSSPPSQSTGHGRKSGEGGASSVAPSKPGPAGSGAKKHQCLKCNKGFSSTTSLKRHDLVHTGEKPHSCRLCLKVFAQSEHLKKHEHTHDRK